MDPIAVTDIIIRQPTLRELEAVSRLRHEALDEDKSIPPKGPTDTDKLSSTIHMAAFAGDAIICTVRLNPIDDDPNVYLVRRMATKSDYRNQGVGARVLRAAEAEAVKRGAKAFVLDARLEARNFYARSGYWPTGQHPEHDGDVNISMAKQVKL
ncbi:MAG TPA: GNAT family N-acetyltransferase [Candidatus Saccharimonadia bacterium]|jgi:predicted GNAT family N-acyltransferase